MEDEAGMPAQPRHHLRVFVGGIVVEDEVNHLPDRHPGLDGIEEADELLMAVALHAAADHRAFQDIQCGEQGRRAVAFVIVGHRACAALLHRQAGLGAVERLDLAFLVDRQHHRVRRRIDVKADHVPQLVGELRVIRELELAHPVRRETVAVPDALHGRNADPGGLGHRRRRPVGRLAGRVAGRQLDHPRDHRLVQGRLPRWPRLVAQQTIDAGLHEPLLPAPDHRFALAGLPHDRSRTQPVGGKKHDPRPPHVFLRAVPIGDDRGQSHTILSTNVNDDPLAHPANSHDCEPTGIPKGTRALGWNH